MPISLSLKEKLYIIALYGDVSQTARERLFSISAFPAEAGPYVMADGYQFIANLKDRRSRKPSLFES